jgi:hypothetical protein
MNESEKAQELTYISRKKFEYYAQRVAEQLEHKDFVEGRQSYWEELKTRLLEKPSDLCGVLDDFVQSCCSKLLKELPPEERRVLWLGTDASDKAQRTRLLGLTHWSELMGVLCDRVKHLALDEAEKEASFGGGFFQDRYILEQVRDVLAAIERRKDLDVDTAAALRHLMEVVESLPDEAPTEFLKLTLDYNVRFEESGGTRIYILSVSPDNLELSLCGSEWTKGVGSDTWSGPSLIVEWDGNFQEDGDIEQMLSEMLDVAGNPLYEISLTKED